MRPLASKEELDALENERSLVGTYVDRVYSKDKLEWLFEARQGFDSHAGDAWHLLIPVKRGYSLDSWVGPESYGVDLSAEIINKLGIAFADLPCVVFRAKEDEFFFLKLGKRTRDEFYEEIGRIADLARECQRESKVDGQAFRDHVNMQVANHLRRRKLLSATKSALPAISALVGNAVGIAELV